MDDRLTPRGDFVPSGISEKDLRDEANRRTAKAGWTTRYGECRNATRCGILVNWGKTKLNVWPRDQHGNLIQ